MKVEVGQQVYVIPRYGQPRTATIEKVGRKWAYIGWGQRFDIKTGALDGRGSVWLSQEEYETHSALQAKWSTFRQLVSGIYYRPSYLTAEDIDAMAAKIRRSI